MPSFIDVELSESQSVSLSFETRQHPLSTGDSDIFEMQRRAITTTTKTNIVEERGYDEKGGATSTSSFTDDGRGGYTITTQSTSWNRQGDSCIWTKTITDTTVTATASGWYNVSTT